MVQPWLAQKRWSVRIRPWNEYFGSRLRGRSAMADSVGEARRTLGARTAAVNGGGRWIGRRSRRSVVLAAGGTKGAVLAALECDDAGGVALLEVTFVDLLFLDAELAGPVTPDAADAGIDQPEQEGDDEQADDDAGHRPSLVHKARSSAAARRLAARPKLGSRRRLRFGSMTLVETSSPKRVRRVSCRSPSASTRPRSRPRTALQNSPVKSWSSGAFSLPVRRDLTQSMKTWCTSSSICLMRSTSSGFSGRKGSSVDLFLPAVWTRRSTPSLPSASGKPKLAKMTPMEPTTELGSAMISSPAVAMK